MSDWLDSKLAEEAKRAEQERERAKHQLHKAGMVRSKLPDFMTEFWKYTESLIKRYQKRNAGNPDREIQWEVGLPHGGFVVRRVNFPAITLRCEPEPEKGLIRIRRGLTRSHETDTTWKEAKLAVTVDDNDNLRISDETSKVFADNEALAEYLLTPVFFFFPEQSTQ
jgi:hypothetical protein